MLLYKLSALKFSMKHLWYNHRKKHVSKRNLLMCVLPSLFYRTTSFSYIGQVNFNLMMGQPSIATV